MAKSRQYPDTNIGFLFWSSSSTFLSFILGRGVSSGHVQHRHAADRAEVDGRQVHPHRRHGRHLRRHVSGRQIFHLNFSLPRLFRLIFFSSRTKRLKCKSAFTPTCFRTRKLELAAKWKVSRASFFYKIVSTFVISKDFVPVTHFLAFIDLFLLAL